MKAVIIISLALNIFLSFAAFTFYRARERNIKHWRKQADKVVRKTKSLESIQEYSSLLEGYTETLRGTALENIALHNEQLDLTGLSLNRSKSHYLILLIDVNTCTTCLDKEMKKIREKGLTGNINIITNENSERQRKVFKNKYSYTGEVHYTPTHLFKQISAPTYLVCDLKGVVTDACVIIKSFPEISDLFLDKYGV